MKASRCLLLSTCQSQVVSVATVAGELVPLRVAMRLSLRRVEVRLNANARHATLRLRGGKEG
jgi:hypothetical protein